VQAATQPKISGYPGLPQLAAADVEDVLLPDRGSALAFSFPVLKPSIHVNTGACTFFRVQS
jgi:hypothetical protein